MAKLNQFVHFHLPDCEVRIPFVFKTDEEIQDFVRLCDAVIQEDEYNFRWTEENSGTVYSLRVEDFVLVVSVKTTSGFSAEWKIDVTEDIQTSYKETRENIASVFPQNI